MNRQMTTERQNQEGERRIAPAHEAVRQSSRSKELWIEHYAGRIFQIWLGRRTYLGVTCHYMEQLKQDLAGWYDEPLKRAFIEATYRGRAA